MFTVSIKVDDVIDALANYIRPFVQDITIIRAQVNRVPEPLNEFVLLTEIGQYEIETPTSTYDGDTLRSVLNPSRIAVQMDIYGENAGDYARSVLSAFRTDFCYEQFPEGIKPLYCEDAKQMPLIDGEMEYETRWMIVAYMQYNPIVSVPQQFADEAEFNLIENVDSNIGLQN